jgi:lysophospholipase L1-like esterase
MYRPWFAVLGVIMIINTQDSLARPDIAGKEDQEITLLALGTSLTANYQWPQELAEQLSRRLARKTNIEILAIAGANSSQATKQFGSRRSRQPDIILIEFAVNDADFMDGIGLEKSKSNHKALLTQIRVETPAAKIVLMTMNPVFGVRRWIRPQLVEYNEIYRQLSANNDVTLVDLYPSWVKFIAASSRMEKISDGLHPTQMAASDMILPTLLRKVGQLVGSQMQNGCSTAR